jgi:PAS domain S-box-containing protein
MLNLDADGANPLDALSTEETLTQRLRVACGAALCAIILYALLDTTIGHPHGWTLRALDAALAAFLFGVLIALRYAATARALRWLAFAGTAAICAAAAAFGIIARDPIGPPVLLCALALTAAIVFPWGVRTQLWTVAMAALAITAQFVWSSGTIRALPLSAVLATITGLAASALIAWELDRHRRGIAERDEILRQHARHQQAWIAALPVTLHRTILHGPQSGRMVFSDNVERLVGYAAAHFIATDGITRWSQSVHPDDRAVFRIAFTDLLSSGRATSEYRLRHSDGSYRWLLTHAVLLRDERGNPSEVIGSMLDLTERKRVEDELARSELRHRLVTQATTDLIWDWDLHTDVVSRNDAMHACFGHAPDAIAAKPAWWLAQIHEQDRARVEASIRAVLDGEHCDWREEYRFRRGNGEYAFVADRGYVMRDELGRPVRMVGAMSDETMRRHADEQLRRSEAHFRSLIEQGSDLITMVDSKGIIRYASPSHFAALGYRPEELVGRAVADFVYIDEQAVQPGELRNRTAGTAEFRFRHANGSWRVLESRVADYSSTGFAGVVANSRDVTDRRLAEGELQRAKEAAEAASRVKSGFLANMSHEIRTPMNAILGMTELALGTDLNGEQREYLESVRAAGDWLLTLINDVLDFSKLESGKVLLDPVDFDLRWALAETLRILTPRAREKGLELSGSVDPAVPDLVVGDPGRLRQVLVNLIGNGIKFTDTGGVAVHVALRDSGDNGAIDLEVCVCDTGIGIEVDKQRAIFEPFEQADSSTTRRHGGTGLGLAICKQLVAIMNGTMWLESEPGRGSAFHFTLRLQRVHATTARLAADTSAALAASRAGVAHLVGRSLRVLLAEDNAVNQRLAVALLEKHGHRTVAVATGREAVAAIRRQVFDVVLMDVQMPDMDGLEASRAIRCLEAAGEIAAGRVPIIAMTAHALGGDRERCLAAGMDGYVSKPVRATQLLEAIGHALSAAAAPGHDSTAISAAAS